MNWLKTNTHSLSNFSRNLSADLGNDRCRLPQFGSVESGITDLAGSINLARINGPVCIQLFVIILLYTTACFCRATTITSNRLTGPCGDSGDLLTGLLIDRNLNVAFILLTA